MPRLDRIRSEFAEARARTKGCTSLDLDAPVLTHGNLAWYRRRGYAEVARGDDDDLDGVGRRKLAGPR